MGVPAPELRACATGNRIPAEVQARIVTRNGSRRHTFPWDCGCWDGEGMMSCPGLVDRV